MCRSLCFADVWQVCVVWHDARYLECRLGRFCASELEIFDCFTCLTICTYTWCQHTGLHTLTYRHTRLHVHQHLLTHILSVGCVCRSSLCHSMMQLLSNRLAMWYFLLRLCYLVTLIIMDKIMWAYNQWLYSEYVMLYTNVYFPFSVYLSVLFIFVLFNFYLFIFFIYTYIYVLSAAWMYGRKTAPKHDLFHFKNDMSTARTFRSCLIGKMLMPKNLRLCASLF